MTEGTQLILDGVRLAAVGMGTVFVFLTTLVFATALMSRLVMRFVPPPAPAPETALNAAPGAHLVAVISAAIHAHQQRQQKP